MLTFQEEEKIAPDKFDLAPKIFNSWKPPCTESLSFWIASSVLIVVLYNIL